jgi:hypothetical protein
MRHTRSVDELCGHVPPDLRGRSVDEVFGHELLSPPPRPVVPYVVGLDLGQSQDFTALTVIRHTRHPTPGGDRPDFLVHEVVHLRRWPLGTEYTAIASDVAALVARPPLPGCALVVDATGVGRAVVEMVRRAKPDARLVPVTIHGGRAVTGNDAHGFAVPKLDLVARLQALLQARRLKVAALPERELLERELTAFRIKVNVATGHETFEAWRERDHDDLVLAVALACWYGERPGRTLRAW